MPAPSLPAPPARHRAERHAAGIALCALLLTTGCSHGPSPRAAAAPAQAAGTAAPNGAGAAHGEGPTTVVAVREVYRTQQVDKAARERCGERIARPPAPSLWSRMFSSAPSDDGDVPAPVFGRETACDTVASEHLRPARYRVVYSFGAEDHSVDLDYDPGAAVRLDATTGHVLGPAALP